MRASSLPRRRLLLLIRLLPRLLSLPRMALLGPRHRPPRRRMTARTRTSPRPRPAATRARRAPHRRPLTANTCRLCPPTRMHLSFTWRPEHSLCVSCVTVRRPTVLRMTEFLNIEEYFYLVTLLWQPFLAFTLSFLSSALRRGRADVFSTGLCGSEGGCGDEIRGRFGPRFRPFHRRVLPRGSKRGSSLPRGSPVLTICRFLVITSNHGDVTQWHSWLVVTILNRFNDLLEARMQKRKQQKQDTECKTTV